MIQKTIEIDITPQEAEDLYGVLTHHKIALLPNFPEKSDRFGWDVNAETLSLYARWCERYLLHHGYDRKGTLTKEGQSLSGILDKLKAAFYTPNQTTQAPSVCYLLSTKKAQTA